MNYNIRCTECGRFMNTKEDFIVSGPYGMGTDLEPPDDEFIHRSCFEAKSKEGQELTKGVSFTWHESWRKLK